MPSEFLNERSIKKAIKAAERREDMWLNDTGQTGLSIRSQSGKATWYFKTKTLKVGLADIGAFGFEDIPMLRKFVGHARALPDDRVRDWLRAAILKRDVDKARTVEAVNAGLIWRWEKLRDTFLAKSVTTLSDDTHRGYRSALGSVKDSKLRDDFVRLAGKPVTEISSDDIRAVRNSIAQRGKRDQARLTLAALKSCFAWAIENAEQTGVRSDPTLGVTMKGSPNPPDSARKDDWADPFEERSSAPRALTLQELAHVLLALPRYPNQQAALAVGLQMLTGQRRLTVAKAERHRIVETEKYLVWEIPTYAEKSRKTRPLPLPSLARDMIKRVRAGSREGRWLFPQQRLRRAGDKGDTHMSARTISQVLLDLRTSEDGLRDAPWLATHDLRRAFVTHMKSRLRDLDLQPTTTIALVTRSDEGRQGLDATVYDLDPNMQDKAAILNAWNDLLVEAINGVRTPG